MILKISASVNQIIQKDQGRSYPWPRHQICPCCKGHKLWGHGYVLAYFDGYDHGVWLKRYRCPNCHKVYRMRPQSYWPRFQSSIKSIRDSLQHRLRFKLWPPGLAANRQRHWLAGLKKQITAHLNKLWEDDAVAAIAGFDRLMEMNRIPVGRSI